MNSHATNVPSTSQWVKMTYIGQPCRNCGVKVVKRIPKKQRKSAAYHYRYYLFCPGCQRMYMLESQKVNQAKTTEHLLFEERPQVECKNCLHGIGRHCLENTPGGCYDYFEVHTLRRIRSCSPGGEAHFIKGKRIG